MNNPLLGRVSSFIKTLWRYLRWVAWALLVLVIVFVHFVFYTMFWQQPRHAKELSLKFQTDKITMADVMGENLPPAPDPTENNATLMGIDTNRNGIRDDVELAIFRNHPDSARVRSALLQYAKALQYEFDDVQTNVVWKVVFSEVYPPAIACVMDAADMLGGSTSAQIKREDSFRNEVQVLVFNTESRKEADRSFNNLESGGGYKLKDISCDIPLDSLPN